MARLNLLLDTHVFLWLLFDDAQLGPSQRELLKDTANKKFVSSVSIFEIATKARIGKLTIPALYAGRLSAIYSDFEYLPLSLSVLHAEMAGNLIGTHKDPFDRMLAAQSIVENMPIMTVDVKLRELGAEVVW
jgi:PIN domain nuclease of toxin-antitoxin system